VTAKKVTAKKVTAKKVTAKKVTAKKVTAKKVTDLFFRFFSRPALLPIHNAPTNDRFDLVCKSIIPG